MKALATSPSRGEALAEALGVLLGLWILLAGSIHGRVGQAHDQAPSHAQDANGVGAANPAQVLLQREVQAVVQPALDDPVVAFEPEHPQGLQPMEGATADEINRLAFPFAVAPDPGLQAGH